MLGSDHLRYVPLLKCKQGELDALSHIDQPSRDGLTPLIEIGPIETDPKTQVEVRSLGETLDGVADKIAKAWGSLDFCFVDL